jgi:fructan beta-fructosidase
MRNTVFVFIIILIGFKASTQQTKNDTTANKREQGFNDPFRLDYKDVFDNVHYNQPLRPQVHYTPITGQIADPTGLIRYKGTYHLFYMFDEWSKQRRDNKNWGHATSNDGIFWEQQPHITNSVIDNRPGSGSGIVDWNNTLGLRTGVEKTMVVFYTDYGRGISLAYSKDAGKTWIRHKNNPLLPIKNGFRDPVVFWYKPDQSWRMVIYEEPGISFYRSDNLLNWHFLSKMEGFFECPDMIHMSVDGNEENKKWVLIDGNGSYYIGEFDGTKFIPMSKKNYLGQETFFNKVGDRTNYYTKDLYATQTWKQSYEVDGPFYQLAFMMIKEPPTHNRTWSQQLIFPVELTLRTINKEVRLCRNPIDGIKQLRYDSRFWKNTSIKPNENPLEQIDGDVFEIISEIQIGNAKEIVFDIRGEKVVYNTAKQQLQLMDSQTDIIAKDKKIKLRFIIDRNSIEIYANQGEVTFTRLFYPDPANKNLSLSSVGGSFHINSMEFYRLESIWLKREQELGYKREKAE